MAQKPNDSYTYTPNVEQIRKQATRVVRGRMPACARVSDDFDTCANDVAYAVMQMEDIGGRAVLSAVNRGDGTVRLVLDGLVLFLVVTQAP